ncbi:carbohydrate binding domain-containing protein [Pseudoalteromonas sp. Of7M-16]|uniref:carbohydrate binding domain-containing protein n=1 Tax=Pseudoalteromonas sp. Of7M-16 TaxID=2917756 RepID=UPI001EF6BDD4|nr:carbohydrate binding domain-containing protein [Pseudoalteromonas sp. Of7M-16]MCG7551045.1 carbohydrate binding domain-containing protein [Pseudoalteromonas sp. Of7M-16]
MNKMIRTTSLSIFLLGACNVNAEQARGEWIDKFDLISGQYQAQYPNSFSRSSNLAWAEAYYLDALIEMYLGTKDPKYLDVFTARSDMAIALAKDDTGMGVDGFKGWGEWKYSIDAIQNSNAELVDPNDSSLPANWSRWQSTAATAYRNTTEADNIDKSTAAFTIKTAPQTNRWHVLQTPLRNPYKPNEHFDPNSKYQINFHAKIENCDAGVKGRLQVYDFTQRKVLLDRLIESQSYQYHTADFVSPENPTNDVQVRLYTTDYRKHCTVHFDNISVKSWREYLVHDGMITAPMAKFIKLARTGRLEPRFSQFADEYYDFLVTQIFPKWQKDLHGTLSGNLVYLFADDSSSRKPGQSLPHNQYLALQRTYAELAQIEGHDPNHKFMAQELIKAFKSSLKLGQYHSGSGLTANKYEWSYWSILSDRDTINDGFNWTGTEDTSHGNLDVAAAFSSYYAGVGLNKEDMTYFANTADFMISHCDNFSKHVNKCYGDESFTSLRWWMQLAEFKPSIYHDSETKLTQVFNAIQGVGQRYYMGAIAQLVKGYRVYDQPFDYTAANALPEGWRHWQSTPETVFLSPNSAFSGSQGLTVKNRPTYGWQVAQKVFDYEPGATYRLDAMARVFSGDANGRVMVYDATSKKSIAQVVTTSRGWSPISMEFTVPNASGHNLQIYLYSTKWQVESEIHFDDLEILRIN